jgi:porin
LLRRLFERRGALLSHFARNIFAIAVVGMVLNATTSFATPPPQSVQQEPESTAATQPAEEGTSPGFLTGIERSSNLLGDMFGLRTLLSKYGMSLSISETSEIFGNVSGGAQTGFVYDGLTQMDLQLDTKRAFDLDGGTFNVSGLQIHGQNLSEENLLTLQTASGIEADPATRLWELWYQQQFGDDNPIDVKVGQQSLDQEFMVSQNALLFCNTMFGWPMVPSADLPGGGPAYPLSALGIRLRAHPTDSITVLGGIFSGSPVENNSGDPQQDNPSGTSFPLNNGILAIAEIQYAWPAPGAIVYPGQAQPLSGVAKLGFWYDSEDFPDQHYDNTGLSLADPNTTGIPLQHRGNCSIYAVYDQMLWASDEDANRTLNFFFRPMGTPQTDRNLIEFSMNVGATLHDPLPDRDDDTAGIGLCYAKVSRNASDLDRDFANQSTTFLPVRTDETVLELTYQYQVTPWWILQPDFQYVFNPGAGVANPNAPGERVQDEAVFGLRTIITF